MSKVKPLAPKEAAELLEKNPGAVMIDVCSSVEFIFVGYPLNAINTPWIDEPDWKIDPNFAKDVRRVMLVGAACDHEGGAPVVLVCHSGRRSRDTAELLIEDGFTEIYNVEHGFEGPLNEKHHRSTLSGWRFECLPWEQC